MRVVVTPHCRWEITGLVGESDVAAATGWPVAKMVSWSRPCAACSSRASHNKVLVQSGGNFHLLTWTSRDSRPRRWWKQLWVGFQKPWVIYTLNPPSWPWTHHSLCLCLCPPHLRSEGLESTCWASSHPYHLLKWASFFSLYFAKLPKYYIKPVLYVKI